MIDALDPQRLRLLVELRRRGSISAAAEACRMGQPSATKHLKTLEAAVGEKLVERNGRASRLTDAGEVVALHAQRVLDTLEGMQEELREPRGRRDGGSARRVAGAGRGDRPAGRRPRRAVPRRRAGRHRRAGAAAARSRQRRRSRRRDAARARARLQHAGDRRALPGARRLPARQALGARSSEAIKRSVRAGLGIGFVSRLEVSEEIGRGELEAFGVAGVEPMRRSVFLLRPDGRDLVPAERAFVETLHICIARRAG